MSRDFEIGLSAAVVRVVDRVPYVLVVPNGEGVGLPYRAFSPQEHRTFELALMDWLYVQTGLELSYVEQLYTFGDRGRVGQGEHHVVSVGYLALTHLDTEVVSDSGQAPVSFDDCYGHWVSWYQFFPWEVADEQGVGVLDHVRAHVWNFVSQAHEAPHVQRPFSRIERFMRCFDAALALPDPSVLERYELLYEAGLVREALNDGRETALQRGGDFSFFGQSMVHDHRRILATAMSRLRGKIDYKPLILDVMAEQFTLTDLQDAAEAFVGHALHKQNFRRRILDLDLVCPLEGAFSRARGRPAQLYVRS